ncbi:MAG: replication-associated recombination protein A [Succinivibrio sp.]|nr:replication-associated recombination protein A [Succinivibrio sp.]
MSGSAEPVQGDLFAALEPGAPSGAAGAGSSVAAQSQFAPLSARLRPHTPEQFIGQQHLMGEGRPLRQCIEQGQCHSMILWGPPGVGKTTLALMMAQSCQAVLEQIPAVTSGVKDIREAIERARQRRLSGQRTVLFVDEVHRFNKSQQDAFLPHVEDGTVTFIGATTENPSFSLNGALLSRARVYLLKPLQPEDLDKLLTLALSSEEGLKDERLVLNDEARAALVDLAAGDARRLLNMLEMASDLALPDESGQRVITTALLSELSGRRLLRYDKGGDVYYDLISAFHKSVRGSAPDAALYWYCRILEAGGDPLYVARRLLAIATEDVGLADPKAMQVALNAYDIFERVGPAEGERAIAEAAVYLALAPKSNHLYTAFAKARADASAHGTLEVPTYLRNAPTKLMEELGYHQGYRYAHDYEGAYAAGECFLPEELAGTVYYKPSERGYEKLLTQKKEYLRQRDAAAPEPRHRAGLVGKNTSYNAYEDESLN